MESKRKSSTDYSDYHKRKSSTGIDKRTLRAHRRSLEWKSFRADGFNTRRDLADLSPLKEVDPVSNIEHVAVEQTQKPVSKAEATRKAKLQKWKEEKELKRQIDAKKNKKQVFKVAKIEHHFDPFKPLQTSGKTTVKAPVTSSTAGKTTKPIKPIVPAASNVKHAKAVDVKKPILKSRPAVSTANSKTKPPKAVPTTAGNKQDNATSSRKPPLRSQPTRAAAKNQDQDIKTRPAARTKRNEPSAPAVSTRTTRSTAGRKPLNSDKQAASKIKKEPSKPASRQTAKTINKKSSKLDTFNTEKVNCNRDTSFAPNTFQFTAPENIQSFVFKPMSPASAAAFLLSSPKTARSRCSTPIQSEGNKRKVPTPSEAIEGYDVGGVIPLNFPADQCKNQTAKPATASSVNARSAQAASEEDSKPRQVSGTDTDTPAVPTKESVCKENICPGAATPGNAEFRTPGAVPRSLSRRRGRSLGTALSSGSRWKTPKNNRTSLILRALSPEEGVEVLKHSPMIELERRTPKQLSRMSTMPNFDDVSDDVFTTCTSGNNGERNKSDSELLISHETKVEGRPTVLSDPLPSFVGEEKPVANPMSDVTTSPCLLDDSKVSKPSEVLPKDTAMDMGVSKSSEVLTVDKNEVSKSSEVLDAENPVAEPVHDVPYFRKLVVSETDRLNQLCSKWETVNNSTPNINEEALGEVRTTIGKAQLLIAQRFKQFTGLIDNCEFNTGEKATHCSDLDGFWEMIFYQVEDINKKFEDLGKLQANNWQFDKPEVKKKKIVKKKTVASKLAVKSKFAAFRAQMKQQKSQKPSTPLKEPPAVVVEPAEDVKTFEGGFFAISSPVKSPKVHCEGGTPGKSLPGSGPRTPSGSPLVRAVLEKSARSKHSLLLEAVSNVLSGSPKITDGEVKSGNTPIRKSRRRSEVLTSSSDENLDSAKYKRRKSEVLTPGNRKRRRSSRLASLLVEEPTEPNVTVPSDQSASLFTPAHPNHRTGSQTETSEDDGSTVISSSRKSIRRTRKSVSFSSSSDAPMETDDHDNFLTKYLQPSSEVIPEEGSMEFKESQSPEQDVDMAGQMKRDLSSEFDVHAQSTKKRCTHASAPGGRSSSSPGSLVSPALARPLTMSERRASRRKSRRSVHFSFCASPSSNDQSLSVRAPSTPFNRDCLVAQPRSSGRRRSSRSQGLPNDMVLFTPPSENPSTMTPKSDTPATKMSKLRMDLTPSTRTKRVSGLLFTPPQKIATPERRSSSDDEEQTVNLMSFSPLSLVGAGHH